MVSNAPLAVCRRRTSRTNKSSLTRHVQRARPRQGVARSTDDQLSRDVHVERSPGQLAKEHERDILRQQMARDLVSIAMRRLRA